IDYARNRRGRDAGELGYLADGHANDSVDPPSGTMAIMTEFPANCNNFLWKFHETSEMDAISAGTMPYKMLSRGKCWRVAHDKWLNCRDDTLVDVGMFQPPKQLIDAPCTNRFDTDIDHRGLGD